MVRALSSLGVGLLAISFSALEAQQVQVQQQQGTGIQKRQGGDQATQAAQNAEQTGRVGRVRDLVGMDLLNQQGESLGMVDDLMINKKTGQVEFILVSQSEDSQDLHPVPWKSVTWHQDDKDQYLVIGVNQQKFQQAPVIVREQLPTMTYTQWNTVVPRVQSFYGPIAAPQAGAVTRREARAIRRALND